MSNHYQQPTDPGDSWAEERPARTSWGLWAIVAIVVIAIALGAAFLVGQGAGDPAEEVAVADVVDDTSGPETQESAVVEGEVRLELADGHRWIARLVEVFPGRIKSVRLGKPTLEDVFIDRTGHRFWTSTVE